VAVATDRYAVSSPEQAEVVVVGAGIAGLAAAWELRDRDLLVLETEERVGGRLYSLPREPYWLNFGGHVLGGDETATGRLLADAGVAAASVPGVLTAVAMNGKLLGSGRIETYPFRLPLSVRDRLALLRTGARLRIAVWRYGRVATLRPGESEETRRMRVLSYRDDESFASFLGNVPVEVDALIRPTIQRSSAEPEDVSAGYGIGYFQLVWDRGKGLTRNVLGGSARLPETLAAALGERVRTRAQVTTVVKDGAGVRVSYAQDGTERDIRAAAAVLATPAHVTVSVAPDLPTETRDALARIDYGPYVVAAFLTAEQRPMPYDGIYALATPKRSFNMLFNTANVLRTGGQRQPGGSLMVYSAASLAKRLEDLSDDDVREIYLRDLEELFPGLRAEVTEVRVVRWPKGLPHPHPGRHLLQPALERSDGPIFLAGDYLGTTHVETAIQTGTAAARAARTRLTAGPRSVG
jgi:oxygen-dependent protoporphyrinogen oxidase